MTNDEKTQSKYCLINPELISWYEKCWVNSLKLQPRATSYNGHFHLILHLHLTGPMYMVDNQKQSKLWYKTIKFDLFVRLRDKVGSSDGFELEFSGSSEPELKIFRAESNRAGAF